MTPARERKAKERAARKEAGLVRIEAWVPAARADSIRQAIAVMAAPFDGSVSLYHTWPHKAAQPCAIVWEWSEGPGAYEKLLALSEGPIDTGGET